MPNNREKGKVVYTAEKVLYLAKTTDCFNVDVEEAKGKGNTNLYRIVTKLINKGHLKELNRDDSDVYYTITDAGLMDLYQLQLSWRKANNKNVDKVLENIANLEKKTTLRRRKIMNDNIIDFKLTRIKKCSDNAEAINAVYGTSEVAYGLPLPDDAVGGVSCRLIWDRNIRLGTLEYVQDRAEYTRVADIVDFDGLTEFSKVVMRDFRSWALAEGMDWNSEDYLLVAHENNRSLLNCNGSCGHVYASFWEVGK